MTLSTAHWPDVEAGPRRLLVVPVGSLEQHGAHLPLDTDTRIASISGTSGGQALSRTRIRSSSASNAPQGMSFLDGK